MAKQVLDSLDRHILKLISQDARIPFLEVARACNVSGAAIHQRVAKLQTLALSRVHSLSSIQKRLVMRPVPTWVCS